MNAY